MVFKNKIKFQEQKNLGLNIEKAKKILKWKCILSTKKGVRKTVQWYFDVVQNKKNSFDVTNQQIEEYMDKSNLK